MPLRIRRYVEADKPRVLELHMLGLAQFDATSPRGEWDLDLDDVEGAYLSKRGEFLVGELDGKVVAIGGFRPKTERTAELKRMRVDPAYQGRGFGQAILSELERRARALGYSSMFLDTLETMAPARAMYSKNGYVQTGTEMRGRFGVVLYEKDLEGSGRAAPRKPAAPRPRAPSLKFGKVEQRVFFEAAPEEVYDALLDPRKHAAFTGSPATTSRRVGAAFTAWDGYIAGKNLELVEGKKIVQAWSTTEFPEGYPPSRLELTLTPKRGGTELRMVHSGVPVGQVDRYAEGWKSAYWDPLKEYLEKRASAPASRAGRRRRRSLTR